MKQYDDLNSLIGFLGSEKLKLSSDQQEKLKIYLERLVSYSLSHRIISRNDIELIVERHFLSSFYFVFQLSKHIKVGDNILDLGSGAGFPGIILSIFFDQNSIVLVDSIRKKTLFLKKLVKELDLHCDVVCERIEDYGKQEKRKFRFVTARALASVKELQKLSLPFMPYAELHTIKGVDYQKEIEDGAQHDFKNEEIPLIWKNYSGYLENKIYLKMSLKSEK